MKKRFWGAAFFAVFILGFQLSGIALPTADYFPPLQESKAYEKFKRRPVSNYSKIMYLIDRFEPTGAEIYYDGFYFKAPIAAMLAKAFLMRNYRKENVNDWIMKWCHLSIGGNHIYAKFPDGKYLRASDILLEEWEALEAATAN